MKFSIDNRSGHQPRQQRGFTLIELILVMMLLIIMVTIVTPKLMAFFNGRKLDSEVRQFVALTHYAQSRAVSEGVPMLLWVDSKTRNLWLAAGIRLQHGRHAGGDVHPARGIENQRGQVRVESHRDGGETCRVPLFAGWQHHHRDQCIRSVASGRQLSAGLDHALGQRAEL